MQTYLEAVEKPRVQCIGYELVDACVQEAEDCKCSPLAPIVDLEPHKHCLFAWANVHVAHVERPENVKDAADCNHPHQQQCYSPSLVVKQFPEKSHVVTRFSPMSFWLVCFNHQIPHTYTHVEDLRTHMQQASKLWLYIGLQFSCCIVFCSSIHLRNSTSTHCLVAVFESPLLPRWLTALPLPPGRAWIRRPSTSFRARFQLITWHH